MPAAPTVNDYTFGFDTGNTTATVVTTPANAAGDELVLFISSDAGSQTFTDPTGLFTKEYNDVSLPSTAATFALFKKTSNGSEPSTFTFNLGTSERQSYVFYAVRGGNVVNVKGTNASGTGTTATIPGLTTTVDNCLVFGAVITDGDTQPHGTTTDYSNQVQTGSSTASTLGLQYMTKTTAGTVADNTCSLNASQEWLGISIAIEPASGGLIRTNRMDGLGNFHRGMDS